ncbi:MAG: two-component regulator propeller domain-containing protein [Saprospiraceae bacterium]|nr:two-component regulator propeller domain-containing protein [Saprospiraceae bacterium]
MFQRALRITIGTLSLLLSCAVPSPGQGDDPVIYEVDLRPFDAHPMINQTVQDPLGYIWIASDLGFYRFDGVHVRHYSTRNTPGLPGDVIYSLLPDRHGALWIATNQGLVIMDIATEVVRPFPLVDSTRTEHLIPTKLYLASDSMIWVGMMNNRIGRMLPGGTLQIGKLEFEDFPLGECFNVTALLEDQHGRLFIEADCAYRTGIFLLDRDQSFLSFRLIYWGTADVLRLFLAAGTAYVLDHTYLYPFDPVTGTFAKDTLDHLPAFIPSVVTHDGHHTFLAASKQGQLWRCMINSGKVSMRYLGKFTDTRILNIMQDRSGCLWLGTDDGVYFFSDRQPRFTALMSRPVPGQSYGLRTRGILEAGDGNIYISTYDGIFRIDPLTLSHELVADVSDLLSLPYALGESGADYLWLTSDGYGFAKLDPVSGVIYDRVTPYADKDRQFGRWAGEIIRDSEGRIWVGSNDGVLRSVQNEAFKLVRDTNGDPILLETFVHDIKEIRTGKYWIGTNHGLFELQVVGEEGTRCRLTKHSTIPFRIREISLTNGPHIWIATEDAGLVHYNPDRQSYTNYTEANGLPSNVLYSLLPGPNGELWIGTYEGLSRFDTATQLFSNFYVSDGLPHNEFNSQSQLIASDGHFYMGTQDGYVRFHPDDFTVDSSDLPMMISEVQTHNTKLDSVMVIPGPQLVESGIHLGPHDNLVTVRYSIADYNKPDGNRFQYQLSGISTKWHYLGSKTEFVLPHLRPGTYTLSIRGAGSDGRWSSRQLSIPITVSAAWYSTWWFSVSVLVFLAGIMWMIHHYRLQQVKKLHRMRLRIAEDLHDELGSTLTGIGIQTELLSASESENVRKSRLTEISGHIQNAVSRLGDIVWSLQPETSTLGDLMDRVEEQAYMMLKPSNIECQLSLPRADRDLVLADVVKQNCFLIFKEAVTNIVKHSSADKVEIIMRCQNPGLLLSITDNGTPAPSPSANGGGHGLKNMRRRAMKMSGELTISNDDGYRVALFLPRAFVK